MNGNLVSGWNLSFERHTNRVSGEGAENNSIGRFVLKVHCNYVVRFEVYRKRHFNPCTAHPLQWRHNGRDGVSNHQPHDCSLNRLFRHRWKKNIKAPRHWPLCGEFSDDRWFPAQRSSNVENVSIWRRQHVRIQTDGHQTKFGHWVRWPLCDKPSVAKTISKVKRCIITLNFIIFFQ